MRGCVGVIGQYQHNMDTKGRLFIPARLREKLGSTFYVTIGMDQFKYLSVFSEASWKSFTERISSLPYSKAGQIRLICGNAVCCEPDAQGRILIPQKLRDYAELQKDIIVLGVITRCEIWSAENWRANEDANLQPEMIARMIETLEI